jgi:uncharacterized membrane protein YfcA
VKDSSYYILLPFLVITAYLGVRTGRAIMGKVDQVIFRRIVLIALLAAGIKILF